MRCVCARCLWVFFVCFCVFLCVLLGEDRKPQIPQTRDEFTRIKRQAKGLPAGSTLHPLAAKAKWPLGWSEQTGDSRSRLLFGHGPSDHECLFVIMVKYLAYKDVCVNVYCELEELGRSLSFSRSLTASRGRWPVCDHRKLEVMMKG